DVEAVVGGRIARGRAAAGFAGEAGVAVAELADRVADPGGGPQAGDQVGLSRGAAVAGEGGGGEGGGSGEVGGWGVRPGVRVWVWLSRGCDGRAPGRLAGCRCRGPRRRTRVAAGSAPGQGSQASSFVGAPQM